MSELYIPLPFARLLLRLTQGEEIPLGQFSGRSKVLLKKITDDFILEIVYTGSQRKKIRCPDISNLYSYLKHKFDLNSSLKDFVEILEDENSTRVDATRISSDSKYIKKRVFKGFLINSYDTIQCLLNNNRINVPSTQGTMYFIADYMQFFVPEDVTIVIVENYTNFLYTSTHKQIPAKKPLLYLWRFTNSKSIVEWLNNIPNDYIYFGDFDLKGMHIYLSEFKKNTPGKTCDFYIPDNIEDMFRKDGNVERFENQKNKVTNCDFNSHPELVNLYKLIEKYKVGVDQESLLKYY